MQEYIEGKRVKHFRPFGYVMIMGAISTLLVQGLLWIRETIIGSGNGGGAMPDHEAFFAHYFSIFVFIMIPLASCMTWLFFLRQKYNFWEHFLANTYIAAQLNVIWVLLHLAGMITLAFNRTFTVETSTIFFVCFMTFFLYMYGSVFGYLMKNWYRTWKLVALLTLMNFVLFITYATGFQLAGLLQM